MFKRRRLDPVVIREALIGEVTLADIVIDSRSEWAETNACHRLLAGAARGRHPCRTGAGNACSVCGSVTPPAVVVPERP